MRKRHLTPLIETLSLKGHKMALISGPRQCGKTTLAKGLLNDPNLYFSWDQPIFRRLWNQDPEKIAKQALSTKTPRLVLDEFHKNKRWKSQLKGFYDTYGQQVDIVVTGSAKLNTYRKGGDSLLGRFYHFHLHPFSLSEYQQSSLISWESFLSMVEKFQFPTSINQERAVGDLLKFGGFPEPLLTGKDEVLNLWQKNRIELLIRQDLRDLTQIQEISQVEVLTSILPTKVGAPLSIQSLREDLEVAFTTVQRWLRFLEVLYHHFEIKPFSKSILRSLKKEGKIYLYDWSDIPKEGARFENMIACHLKKLCDHWTDTGKTQLQLHYLRNKEKKEVDFLITKNKKPWFTIECKLNDLNLDQSYQIFQKQIGVPHFQITQKSDILRVFKTETGSACVVSFDRFFSNLP